MPTISLCMIVKNEQEFLRECLLSVRDFVDEIIVLDTGSTDATKAIAREFTSQVIDFAWTNDFAAARNESIRHATGEWILVLDADEILDAGSLGVLREALADDGVYAYYLPQLHYTNIYLTHPDFVPLKDTGLGSGFVTEFKGYYPCFVLRLFRRIPEIFFSYCVHETIYPSLKKGGRSPRHLLVPIHHLHERKGISVLDDKQEYYFKLSLRNIEQYPSYAKSYNDVAVYYNRYTHDLSQALYYCRKAVELEPENVDYGLHLSYLLRDQGDFEQAILVLEKVTLAKDERAFRALGHLYAKLKMPAKAIKAYQTALDIGSPFQQELEREIELLKSKE